MKSTKSIFLPLFICLGCGGLVDGTLEGDAFDSTFEGVGGSALGAQGSGAATANWEQSPAPGTCGLRIEGSCVTCFQESWESDCQAQSAAALDPTCKHVIDCLDVHCACEGAGCSSFCDCLSTCAEPDDECLVAWRQLISCGTNACQEQCQ